MREKVRQLTSGLRWSPKPMKDYVSSWNLGPGVATLYNAFTRRPDVWNLYWISASRGCEERPYLTAHQVDFLKRASEETAEGIVAGERVGALTLRMMPLDFADHLEAHPKDAEKLKLQQLLAPNWLFVMRDRSDLFYEARKSEHGLTVPEPQLQDETILKHSTNIVSILKLKPSGPS